MNRQEERIRKAGQHLVYAIRWAIPEDKLVLHDKLQGMLTADLEMPDKEFIEKYAEILVKGVKEGIWLE